VGRGREGTGSEEKVEIIENGTGSPGVLRELGESKKKTSRQTISHSFLQLYSSVGTKKMLAPRVMRPV
jgi:hypothetical protein